MPEQAPSEKLNKKEIVILLLIIFLGFIVRIYNLGSTCVTLDEGMAAYFPSLASIKDMMRELPWNGQQPLYFILMRYWINIFGTTEFILRIPSVLIGTATLYVTFELGRLLFSKQVGLISAAITALSTFHINYSQEARPYILSTLLSLLSVYFFVKIIYATNIKNTIAYITSTVLLVYSHFTGVFIILAQILFLFIYLPFTKEKSKIFFKKLALVQAAIFFLSLPCLYFTFQEPTINTEKVKSLFTWVNKPTLITVFETFTKYFSSSVFLSIIFFLLLLKLLLSSTFNNKYIHLLILLVLSIPASILLISETSFPIYIQRYTLPSSILFYILISLSIYRLTTYKRLLIISTITLISAINIITFFNNLSPFGYRLLNTKEAVNYIEGIAERNDLLIVSPFYYLEFLYKYYSRREDLVKKGLSDKYKSESYIIPDDFQGSNLDNSKNVWLLIFHREPLNEVLEKEILKTHKLLIYKKSYPGIEVKLYTKVT